MLKTTKDKPATERIEQIERYLKDNKHKSAEDYARVLREVNFLNHDLVIDKFISEALPLASSLYLAYRNAACLLYLRKYDQTRKEKLLSHYDLYQQDYPLVLRWMLEADDLYKQTRNQERRDFIVKLLTKMLAYWLPGTECNQRELRDIVQNPR